MYNKHVEPVLVCCGCGFLKFLNLLELEVAVSKQLASCKQAVSKQTTDNKQHLVIKSCYPQLIANN